MQPTSNKGLYIVIGLTLFAFLSSVAFNIYLISKVSSQTTPSRIPINGDSFFDSQNASVNGQITKTEGNTITIKNKNGVTKQFGIARDAVITTSNPAVLAAPLTNPNQTELNKPVFVSFKILNNEYIISSITAVIDLSSPDFRAPPQATSSGTSQLSAPPLLTLPSQAPSPL